MEVEELLQHFAARSEAVIERLLGPVLENLQARQGVPKQELFSVNETAKLTGLSHKHIRRAVKKGELACSNLGGEKRPTLRISRQAIDAWVAANRVKQAPSKSDRDILADRYFPSKKRVTRAA